MNYLMMGADYPDPGHKKKTFVKGNQKLSFTSVLSQEVNDQLTHIWIIWWWGQIILTLVTKKHLWKVTKSSRHQKKIAITKVLKTLFEESRRLFASILLVMCKCFQQKIGLQLCIQSIVFEKEWWELVHTTIIKIFFFCIVIIFYILFL